MSITLDTSSPVPVYTQISQQIGAFAANGTLAVGARLPTVRQLARDLDIAPGTVARAYRELEESGVVLTEGRKGTRIASRKASPNPDAVRAAADHLAIQAHRTGTPLPQILATVTEAFTLRSNPE